jgi:hypothetical protein
MEETNQQQPAPAGSNKKLLYIIGGVVIVIFALGSLSRGIGYMGMRAAGVDVRPGPNGSATYSNGEGTVTVGGNKMPDNWPSDAPANYSGASITYSGSSNPQTGQAGSAVMYTVKASADDIANYYKTQLTSSGWTIETTANAGGATVIAAKKDTRTFGLYIASAEAGTVAVQASVSM